MGNTLLVGIGGSGAKAVESFIHLAAAGLGPDKVSVAIVDQDASNGNTNQTLKTADLYRKLRTSLRTPDQTHALPADCPFLQTEIDLPPQLGDALWCPLPGDGTMRKLFQYGSLRDSLKGVMDVLFDPVSEQEMPLQRGFRARPNVGAAVVTTQARVDADHPFWRQLNDAIASVRNGGEVRIFLVGSIFGGTGAAVLPTLAKLIRKLAVEKKVSERVLIGGALLMPYFQFPGDRGEEEGLTADSSGFISQAKSALHYYPELVESGVLDTMYLFGWNKLIQVPRRPSGGDKQVNSPLLPDLFSALAAAHFFAVPKVNRGRILRADRGDDAILSWADLPVPGDAPLAVQQKLGQLIRFAVSYLGSYEPTLSQGLRRGFFARLTKESWIANLIDAKGIDLNDGAVQQLVGQITAYCQAALGWIGGLVQASRAGGSDSDLVDAGLFSQWAGDSTPQVTVAITTDKARLKDFATLISGGSGPDLDAIYSILQVAHNNRTTPPAGQGLGVFLGCLYTAAGFADYSKPDGAPPTTILLPNLSEKHGVPLVGARRIWDNAGGTAVLTTIAAALAVPKADADGDIDAISVPDVWAQAELFAIALQDTDHPLHQPLLEEWRGLLACLALTPEHLANVTTQVISPTALAAQPFEGRVSAKDAKANFGQTLITMLPDDSALTQASWGNIGLITVESAVVGMVVPNVLVCSGRRQVPQGTRIGWIRDGRFADPCGTQDEDVGAEELATIAEYCRRLRETLIASESNNIELRTTLLNLLEEYANDALSEATRRSLGGMGDNFEPARSTLATPPGLELLRESICRLAPEKDRLPSDLKLVLSASARSVAEPAGETPKLTAVLLDPEWTTSKRFNTLRVWRTTAVGPILDNAELCARIREEMAAAGVLLLTPDMLFTPVLCRSSRTDGISSHPDAFRNFLLPVTTLAMTLFDITPETLSIRANGKGFKVSLSLTVIDRCNEKKLVTIEKDYPQAESLDMPDLVRWPNFSHADWPLNFAYADWGNAMILSVREPVMPRPTLVACLDEIDRGKRIARLTRLVTTASGIADRFNSMSSKSGSNSVLFNADEPALGMALDFQASNPSEYSGSDDGRVPAGIVLMPNPAAISYNDGEWLVGVDFGTTNTCVYICEAGGDPKPLRLACRAQSPFPAYKRGYSQEEYKPFMPSNDLSTPFMTAMWVRTDPDSLNRGKPIYTYTLHNTVHPAGTLASLATNGSNLRFDLKWQQRVAGERDGIGDFLRLVVLNVLAEAANAGIAPHHVRWRFSFPQAFHGIKLTRFQNTTKEAVRDILTWLTPGAAQWQKEGTMHSLFQGQRKISEVAWASEGETSALYFADCMDVRLNGSVVTLDIGGHTTDITVWNDRKLVWRNSVELAGRHMFVDYLNRHLEKLEQVVRGDPQLAAAVKTVTEVSRQSKAASVEVVINSPTFDPMLDHLVRDDHLKAFVEVALAAQLHYLGLVLAYLAKAKKLELREGSAITLCLSGKVSKLLRAFQHLTDAPWVAKILSDSSKLAIGPVTTKFSQDPKQEVAYGLVVARARQHVKDLTTDNPDRGLVLGESVHAIPPATANANAHTLAPTDIDDETKLPADWTWEAPQELEEFKTFITQACRHLGLTLKVGPRAMSEIRAEVEDALSQGRAERQAIKDIDATLDADSTIMAPPFIVAAVALLKRIASHDSDITFVP